MAGRRHPNARLIPACAGKTRRDMTFRACARAHPRVCGENSPDTVIVPWVVGSSPRVRGKQPTLARDDAMAGLIPACAGKTSDTV